MLQSMRSAARAFDERIGWRRAGMVLSVAIVALAIFILFRVLRDVNFEATFDAIRRTDPLNIALALLCIGGAFVTLTFYDWFALRTIGHTDVPYRIAALASFTSFCIGHNLGGAVVTAGAIRYRIYSAYNLSLIDVAKVCFVTGLTFWLGNIFVLGLTLLLAPQAAGAVNYLTPETNRMIAFVLLGAIGGYVLVVWRRPVTLRIKTWSLTLPRGPSTLIQIGIGVLDLSCCAMAMYFLLPQEPDVRLLTVVVAFMLSTLLGFASYAPSGIGFFDAVMVMSLSQFNKDELVASLLMFRLIYYIIPFAVALIAIGTREFVLNVIASRNSRDR